MHFPKKLYPVSEFNEFPRNRFQLSAGFNLENGIQFKVELTIFEPQLKFFKFGLSIMNDNQHSGDLKYSHKICDLYI